jgi:hypothetical protein
MDWRYGSKVECLLCKSQSPEFQNPNPTKKKKLFEVSSSNEATDIYTEN